MTVKELIENLQQFDPDLEVAILDGFNGGGYPRQINYGPRLEFYHRFDHSQTYDREDLVNKQATQWIIMGYGCY